MSILTNRQMCQNMDLVPGLREFVEGRERNQQFVTNPPDIDDDLGRKDFPQFSLKESNHTPLLADRVTWLKFSPGLPIKPFEQVFASILSLLAGCFRPGAKRPSYYSMFLGSVLLAACSTKPLTDPILGPDHVLNNVYHKEAVLEGAIKRVAVLPLSYPDVKAAAVSARETLEPVFHAELQKAARFELFYVNPAQLQLWSGQERWDDFDELPPRFLKTVAERTGCDAVLFASLSQYHAYPPIVLGWRMRLVGRNADSLWAVDEIFDAGQVEVSNSARRYDRGRLRNNPVLEDSRSILLSPKSFGQYTLSAIFQTLPLR
jgi:hypothetical protein